MVPRRVLLADPRGYCAGVDRAVRTVKVALERYGLGVYVRKQIVHNTPMWWLKLRGGERIPCR